MNPAGHRPGSRLLVSLCDVVHSYRTSSLLRMDIATSRFTWVDIGFSERVVASGKGLAMTDRHIFHTCLVETGGQSVRTYLVVLDRQDLQVVNQQLLPEVKDGHSLVISGDQLFLASTGTDQVLAYRLDEVEVGTPTELWSPTGSGQDTHHVNSLTLHDGSLLASAVGPRVDGSWIGSQRGYVYDVTNGSTLVDGLSQPHSLMSHGDRVWFCNSQLGTVETVDGGAAALLAGYARGLAHATDGTIYAGTSVGRRPRDDPLRGHAAFHNPWTGGEPVGRCAVVALAPDRPRVEIGLTYLASEIYDLLLW